jgi:hypothetical protein
MCYNLSLEVFSKFSGFSSKLLTKSFYLPFGLLSPTLPCPPLPSSSLGFNFDIRLFKCLPFEPSSTTIIHKHLIRSLMGNVVFFGLPFDYLTHDLFNVLAWHLFLLFFEWCIFFLPHGELARHRNIKARFDYSFLIIRRSFKWIPFCKHYGWVNSFAWFCLSFYRPPPPPPPRGH